ncbi:restriction endonuclease subunit S [Sulfuricurvum sp.]|uniref:restriction endonuclease subunit S n=1 Tax=Sulfuricurvum sp. TaxID=2025608 RepID=UPI002631A37F|nr:restriction endonuclease subunit S [Sulfuricurvum sp.]MDD3595831.1 restriction endonuclease subunit S [Sulfuricurvum sp.]
MEAIVPTGYKKTKVGIIPTDWNLYRIDEVLKRVRKPLEVKPDENYQEIGIRSHGKGLFYKEFTTIDEIGDKSVFWIEPDCFIVNIVFAWEQAIGKTTVNDIGMIASHRFPMYKPQKNVLDLDYLVYLFKSKRGKYLLELASPGGAGRNKTLGQGEFAELKIPLPSYQEQQKIAQILTTWDEAIIKQEELIKEKEELKKGLMQKLLSGDVRFDGFTDEWEEVKLEEVGKVIRGVSYQPDDLSLIDNKETIRLMRSNNIRIGFLDTNKELQYVHKSKVKKNQKLKEGDLAICMANGSKNLVGKNGEFIPKDNFDYTVGAFCAIFSFNNKMESNFLKHLFQTEKYNFYVQNLLAGSNINNLKADDIESMKFKIPKIIAEQQEIAKVLSLADNEINLLKNEFEELKQQKKGLMQKLLTGEVRVKI